MLSDKAMCVKTWKSTYSEYDKCENINESKQIFSNVNLV